MSQERNFKKVTASVCVRKFKPESFREGSSSFFFPDSSSVYGHVGAKGVDCSPLWSWVRNRKIDSCSTLEAVWREVESSPASCICGAAVYAD